MQTTLKYDYYKIVKKVFFFFVSSIQPTWYEF